MKWLITFLLSLIVFTSWSYGDIRSTHLQEIGGITNDSALLAKVKHIVFFPYVFSPDKSASITMQKFWIQELQKWGKVVMKPSSVEHLIEDKNLLHACSLVYQIQDVTSVTGASLPVTQATLTFSRSVLVESNKTQGSGVLWGRQCFIPKTQEAEKAVTETLPLLLESLQKVLNSSSKDLVFYVIDSN